MGVNDSREQLEVAKEQCLILEEQHRVTTAALDAVRTGAEAWQARPPAALVPYHYAGHQILDTIDHAAKRAKEADRG